MFSNYETLKTALKALTMTPVTTSEPEKTLPVAEEEWKTRPKTGSYGTITYYTEAGQANGDNKKNDRSFAGSFDLFSYNRDGEGWTQLIENALSEHCGASWEENSRQYERDTGLFHWEWVFEVTA